jgi:NADH-quinone oxidoreductase subunit G
MTTVNIEIDGEKLEVPQGQMLIEAADEAGITIPRFCYHKKLSIAANCRMCLVDVANSGKPLPACATPVSEGMKVCTTSAKTREAQRAVMEFLLINHPLDCPICDQGGQCELQDVAMEYGQSGSRYNEPKRVVKDKNLGPLISTEMTRCIHCTRCVRFGTEIAGVREMGATGRGEFMEIGTYIERSIDSELSGNIIDLCPVGALTSKPFRFKARAWELKAFSSLSMHDCVGSNTFFHVLNNRVLRTLPRENELLNEVWLSDRDRFSYEALNHVDRLQQPQIKREGKWQAVDWQTALQFAIEKLRAVVDQEGASQLGAILSPNATVEEGYLFQKLFRTIGCYNIDHRTRMIDSAHQAYLGSYPHLGIALSDIEDQEAIVLIGSDIRKEQPIIAHRVRKAALNGAQVVSVAPCEMNFNFDGAIQIVDSSVDLHQSLLEIIKAVMVENPHAHIQLPHTLLAELAEITPSEVAKAAAQALKNKEKVSVLLGQYVITHPHASILYALTRWLALILEATWGEMSFGANSAGAWLAGAVPHRLPMGESAEAHQGLTVHQMWQTPRRAYVLMNVEPEYDTMAPRLAKEALMQASAVVVLSCYDNPHYREYADVILPMTPVSEMAGTYVNGLGDWHSFQAAVMPLGESRPAWKILRVLANMWELRGFGYETLGEVLKEILALRQTKPHYADNLVSMPYGGERERKHFKKSDQQWIRLAPISLYSVDNIVRRASALQETHDAQWAMVKIHPEAGKRHHLSEEQKVWVVQEGERSKEPLRVVFSEDIPLHAAWVPSSLEGVEALGEPFGLIELIPS